MKFTNFRGAPLRSLLVAALIFLGGCATVDPDFADPRDPWEGFNRAVYSFNDLLDRAMIKPLAEGYQAVMPEPLDKGVTNFFSNISDITSAINNLLQFKVGRAVSDLGRVAVNTTIGIGGLFDVASNMDLPHYGEDFGQTLGTWGVASGPFIVLPVLGPSTGRDVVGRVADWFTDPVNYIEDDTVRYSLKGLEVIDKRSDLLSASRVVDQAALDPYAFVRDSYLQKRRSEVHDGQLEGIEEDYY